jgi:hypothetical protein
MRPVLPVLFLALSLLPLTAADLSGEWSLKTRRFGEDFDAARVELQANGSAITGHLNELTLEGTVSGGHLKLRAKRTNDGQSWGDFDGQVTGDGWTGVAHHGSDTHEALQSATTELARWLERDYKLTPNESNVVLGTSIRYEIAEVVDPQAHIVAKIRKADLASLR